MFGHLKLQGLTSCSQDSQNSHVIKKLRFEKKLHLKNVRSVKKVAKLKISCEIQKLFMQLKKE
jgi:hypothetical protein